MIGSSRLAVCSLCQYNTGEQSRSGIRFRPQKPGSVVDCSGRGLWPQWPRRAAVVVAVTGGRLDFGNWERIF
jgi:hypothetical protein